MNTNMISVPLSQETVALAFEKQTYPKEPLENVIKRAITKLNEESHVGANFSGKDCWFRLDGVKTFCKNPTDLFVSVLTVLGERYEDVYDRLSKQVADGNQRKRQFIARRQEDLYSQDASPSVKCEAHPLPGGWWIGTNYSTKVKMQFLVDACHAAEIIFDQDLEVDPLLLDGVVLPFSDDEI